MDFYDNFEEYFLEYSTLQCQYVLDHIQNPDDISFEMNVSQSLLENILAYFEKHSETIYALDMKEMKILTLLKRITAYTAFTFLNKNSTLEVKILSSRLLISISSIPSASAYGIYNSTMIQQLVSHLTKIVSNDLKAVSKHNKSTNKKSLERAIVQIQFDKQHVEGIRTSQRVLAANTNKNSNHEASMNSEEEEGGSDEDIADDEETKEAKPSKEVLTFRQLSLLLRDIQKQIQIFSIQSDGFLLNSVMDLFLGCAFLCTNDSNFTSLSNICQQIIVVYGTTNKNTLTSCYRALLPILTMAARNQLLSDIFKIKKACHKVSISILQAVIESSIKNSVLYSENIQNMDVTDPSNSDKINEDNETVLEVQDHSSSSPSLIKTNSIASSLSFPMVCIVALLQRMTLASPDKIQVRQVLLNSLIEILSDLQSLSNQSTIDCQVQIVPAITHYLSFLSKLSKSSKTSYRAFTLDITAQILNNSWIWNYHSAVSITYNNIITEGGVESKCPPAYDLLYVLLARCKDNSPAVRARAISAITELLLNLSETSDSMMISAMYDIAMGVDVRSNVSSNESLFDILRDRVDDEKTHVKTKALQALSLAFSRSWKKVSSTREPSGQHQDNDVSSNSIQMLVMEDDLELFASKCQDRSLSVRKQALLSLTELLTARPKDTLIQDVWLKAVLPMCFDAETTVSNKVAETMHSILFDNLVDWYRNSENGIASEGTHEDYRMNLVWCLSSRIASLGLLKLLKSVLSTMLKQGYLCVSSANTSTSVTHVVTILKYACCYHLNQSSNAATYTTIKDSFETSNLDLEYIQASNVEEVVKGAWILIEGLVSLSQLNILGSKQEPIKFGDVIRTTGSGDFVVDCYRQKHINDNHNKLVFYDEEDLRIFSVLEILCENLSTSDRQYMKEQLMLYLENFQCECSIASSVVAVMLQLTKTFLHDNEQLQVIHSVSSLVSSKPVVMVQQLKDYVAEWTSQLLASAHMILHVFAFQFLPDNKGAVSESLLTNVNRFLSRVVQVSNNNSGIEDSSILYQGSNSVGDVEFLSFVQTALFMIGEIAMLGFSMEEDHSKALSASKNNDESVASENKCMDHFKLSVPDSLIDLVKVYMGNYLPALEGVTSTVRVCPDKIRANAFITMGKLCMRDKVLARNHVNIFLREVSLSSSNEKDGKHLVDLSALCNNNESNLDISLYEQQSAAVRSNALLVLGDMCVRFTSLVDRHVDTMAQCLQDSNAVVRKNALILLTQLLLQDFLKWKGFLLYRFLLLTVDSDLEIAEFSRSILQKTLGLKYPQLLCSHFTEAVVILNSCIDHPIYHSILRTSINGGIDNSSETIEQPSISNVDKNNVTLSDTTFLTNLSKTQRFSIYEFMSENIDDETKIQISAKLVQDILSAVVDSNSMLLKNNTTISGKNQIQENAFESVLEDTLNLLRSPFLKVGQKQSNGMDDDSDPSEIANDEVDANKGVNAKAAFNQAKTKVLKKLSSQHLVSHTLPVVISLKHVLEAAKSPLQGTLMEFLVSLIKHHKNEVEEALQFDPSLKAEIEYDLKQFEKTKKDVQVINTLATTKNNQSEEIMFPSNATSAEMMNQVKSSSLSSSEQQQLLNPKRQTSPYLDLQQLPARSVVKPILRKSLGGTASRGRTPFDALKSPGMHLSDKMISSALRNTDHNEVDVTDDVSRLTFSHSYHASSTEEVVDESDEINFDTQPLPSQVLFANDVMINNRSSPIKQSRRRSWSVVVDSLMPEGPSLFDKNTEETITECPPQRYTPAKKIRKGRKSRSPILAMKQLSVTDKSPIIAAIVQQSSQELFHCSENHAPVSDNIISILSRSTDEVIAKTLVSSLENKDANVVKDLHLTTITTTINPVNSTTTMNNTRTVSGATSSRRGGNSQQIDSLLSLIK